MGVACLSLGSNVDAEANLRAAVAALRARFGGIALSDACVFPAVGFDGGDFLNAAAVIDSALDPFALNDWLHALEDDNDRRRDVPRFSSRTLDVDLVFYGAQIVEGSGNLQVPRRELGHAFVLQPLADIAPDFVDPLSGQSLAALWRAHPDHSKPVLPEEWVL